MNTIIYLLTISIMLVWIWLNQYIGTDNNNLRKVCEI